MRKEIYILLKQLSKIDISFIVDDIIGPFADPDIPVNIDEECFVINIDTPHGICNLSVIYKDDKNEILFQRFIGESMYEEYRLELNPQSEYYMRVDGKIVELREKGFIITNIDKVYDFDEENNKVVDTKEILKKQEVFLNRELNNIYLGESYVDINDANNKIKILKTLGSVHSDAYYSLQSEYTNTLSISINPSYYTCDKTIYPNVSINGHERAPYRMVKKENAVGRAYDLYEGIITRDNYDDALYLIDREEGYSFFAHDDYKRDDKSINDIIDDLIGRGIPNPRREFSALTRSIAEKYYENARYTPCFGGKYIEAHSDMPSKLEKNNYIKQILLSNHENM